ncbi:MAG: hypothetical protein MJZ84_05105 [Paludibacteraceae bacterium]|nr:hypothetical protein [Paludibacteraceae bacterium]
MDEIVAYIIEFLLYGNKEAAKQVGYTADPTKWSRYKVCIQPNGHLGKDWVLPDLSLPILEQDIIYNTAFFISRAEELINSQRDEHGRFLAEHSLLGQGNRLMIPLIDEYSRVLMKALDLPLPQPKWETINLTHDIDILTQYRHLRGALGGIRRGHAKEVIAAWKNIYHDPAYTFEWLMEQDWQVVKQHPQTKMIYFVKHTPGKGYDYPQYNLRGKDFRHLAHYLTEHGALLGWHSSYYEQLSTSKLDGFSKLSTLNSKLNRCHFLNCSIDKMQALVAAGVTDDYTMGFADKAGFRLQTTRPVRWINPITFELTNLVLHPLTIMDCTLQNEQYMNLSEEEAFYYCQQLIDKVKQYNGELTLLWHNHIMQDHYHQTLYKEILRFITTA